MATDLLLVREGNALHAADPISFEAIQTFAFKETMVGSVRRPRNPKHHRLAFALFNLVFKAQTQYGKLSDLVDALKIATGLFNSGLTIDGIPYMTVGSIAFSSMDQSQFSAWFERVLDLIVNRFLIGADKEILRQQVLEIAGGDTRS